MTFRASHSLFTTTNYVPVVNETDHGTWRRLALLRFPYTFRKPGKALQSDSDRVGDPTLKARIKQGAGGQHDAIVTWAVEGAMRWYADPARSLTMTTKVEADTRAWRSEADRIMGFWDERLIADLYACILTLRCWKRLATGCRSTITSHGPKKPFGPRFEQHAETKRHGVTVARPLQPKGLSR
jgi:putative DNA primase/helicase